MYIKFATTRKNGTFFRIFRQIDLAVYTAGGELWNKAALEAGNSASFLLQLAR